MRQEEQLVPTAEDTGADVDESSVQDRPATPEGALEFMWQAFANLNEWVRFSDTKAAAVLAADAAIIGVAATLLAGNRPAFLDSPFAVVWMFTLAVGAFYSAVHALASLMPQLRLPGRNEVPPPPSAQSTTSSEESSSLVFFMDIEANFPSAREFHAAVSNALADPERAVFQISHQVWVNSRIAAIKYQRVSAAINGLFVTVCLGFVGVVVVAVCSLLRSLNGK